MPVNPLVRGKERHCGLGSVSQRLKGDGGEEKRRRREEIRSVESGKKKMRREKLQKKDRSLEKGR